MACYLPVDGLGSTFDFDELIKCFAVWALEEDRCGRPAANHGFAHGLRVSALKSLNEAPTVSQVGGELLSQGCGFGNGVRVA